MHTRGSGRGSASIHTYKMRDRKTKARDGQGKLRTMEEILEGGPGEHIPERALSGDKCKKTVTCDTRGEP